MARVKLDLPAINKVMKAEGPTRLQERAGHAIQAKVGPHFEVVVNRNHPWVNRVYVQPADGEGWAENQRHNVLIKALAATDV